MIKFGHFIMTKLNHNGVDMKTDRLRLSEFAKIIGETPATLRGLLVRSEAPFSSKPSNGEQRTYSAADFLAWFLFKELQAIGLNVCAAAEAVKLSFAVSKFFWEFQCDKEDAGNRSSDFYLVAAKMRRDRGTPLGKIVFSDDRTATSGQIAVLLSKESDLYGKIDPVSGYIGLGLVSLITLPIKPSYDRCCALLESHGFRMDGENLFEIES